VQTAFFRLRQLIFLVYYFSLEQLRESDRYRQSNDENDKQVPENRVQGIGLNGSVNKRIVAVFIQGCCNHKTG